MKDDRLRVDIDTPYLNALGLAVICFTRLEWDVVWSCEILVPGSITTLQDRTAGAIAKQFSKNLGTVTDAGIKEQLGPLASEFERLVKVRNSLVHGKPGTDTTAVPAENQRLFDDGTPLSIEFLDKSADAFVACSLSLHKFLDPRLS